MKKSEKIIQELKNLGFETKKFSFSGMQRGISKRFPVDMNDNYETVNNGTLSKFQTGADVVKEKNVTWVKVYEFNEEGDARYPDYYAAVYVQQMNS